MAMLSEPRQRKRYNLVPRGKALYEDDSRFGTKMLEKMGWSKGKGLGPNEDGTQEFLRVRYKNDVNGLGYEDRDDHWTQHEHSFSGLLKTLNGESTERDNVGKLDRDGSAESEEDAPRIGFGFQTTPADDKKEKEGPKLKDSISGESLEEKSKRSKVRVHYRKFTRGKDLSQYSEKDLANIFGKKVAEKRSNEVFEQNGVPKEQEIESGEVPVHGALDNFAGVQTIRTGILIGDYFKQKMAAITNKSNVSSGHDIDDMRNGAEEQESKECRGDQQNEKKKKKKRCKRLLEESAEIVNTYEPPKKRRKSNDTAKNDKQKDDVNGEKQEQDLEEPEKERPEPSGEEALEEVKLKKKKKKSRKSLKEEERKESPEKETDVAAKKRKDENLSNSIEMLTEKRKKRKKEPSTEQAIEEVDTSLDKSTIVEQALIPENNNVLSNKDKEESLPLYSEAAIEEDDNAKAHPTNTKTFLEDSLDALKEKLNSYNVYTISSFCAEKFRNVDFEGFAGSNLLHVNGYSHNSELQLNVKTIKGDEKRITDLWKNLLDKYIGVNPAKKTYQSYIKEVRKARKTKQPDPRFHVKTWKRKNAFQPI